MEQKRAKYQESPDEKTRFNSSNKLHFGLDGPCYQSTFFLREAVGQYEKKPLKQQSRSTKHKLQTHAICKTGECGKKDGAKFPACDDHYHIKECQVFMSQIMENRSKKLYRKKLCYGCLGNISKEHNARSCSNRSICKV